MAAPVYVNKSAFASGTGALSVGAVASVVADDLLLLFVESANQTIATPSGWTEAPSSPQFTGTAAAAGGVRLGVFYKWATGADATDTVADSGDHTTAIKIAVRGVHKVTPFNANAGSTQAATTAMSFPGVTTTVADCLIVHGCAQDTDAASTATSGTPTNANLTSLTERHDQTVTAGVGGGLVVITGVKATAGATGNTTSTGSTSVTHAYVTLALAPLPAVTGTLAATETGSDTLVADGTVSDPAVTGSLSAQETGSDTLVSSGQVIVQGALAATETGADTLASVGDVIVQGVLSAPENGSDTLSSIGDVIVQGSLSATDTGTDTLASTGTTSSVVTGALGATETGTDTAALTGKVIVQGTISASEIGSDTLVSTGSVLVIGSLAATETGADSLSSTGDVFVQGTLAAAEAVTDTASISGAVLVKGTLSGIETGSDTLSSSGFVGTQGVLSAVEAGNDSASILGTVLVAGVVDAVESSSDTLVATGTIESTQLFGTLNAQETSSDTVFSYGFTLSPRPITEYNLRLFDSIRSAGNIRGAHKSLRGLEHMMWDRVLQNCEYQTRAYVTAAEPFIWRIGYGRQIAKSIALEEAELRKVRENVWLRSKLTDLYKRVVSANPTAELHDVLLSTLYYYQVENQKR